MSCELFRAANHCNIGLCCSFVHWLLFMMNGNHVCDVVDKNVQVVSGQMSVHNVGHFHTNAKKKI